MEEKKKSLLPIFKWLGIAYVISMVLIVLYSFVLSYTNVPESSITISVIVIVIVSILLSSTMATRSIKEKGLINGAIIGAMYFILLYFLSGVFGEGFAFSRFFFYNDVG